MAAVSIHLGLEKVPLTINDFFVGKTDIKSITYELRPNFRVIPAAISLAQLDYAQPEKVKKVLGQLIADHDFLIIDCPPGLHRDVLIPLSSADEVLLVINPEVTSVVDALKTRRVTEIMGGYVRGAIINKAAFPSTHKIVDELELIIGVPILGVIPEDPEVRIALANKKPIVWYNPKSPAAVAFKVIASKIIGLPESKYKKEQDFIDRLIEAASPAIKLTKEEMQRMKTAADFFSRLDRSVGVIRGGRKF